MATLPLLIGMLTNIYGGIAAMSVLPFSHDQMTLMAIFLLIAHNLIQEGVIQAKSGIHPLKATVFRLVAAAFTVIAVAPFLNVTMTASEKTGASLETTRSLIEALQEWGLTTFSLSIKIFVIIMCILVLLEILKVGFLWLTAVIFGVAYGGAVIVEEVKAGYLTKEELEELHLSIGINHSLLEDPSLFLSLGLSPFWLWVPRMIVAIIAERVLALWRFLKRRK